MKNATSITVAEISHSPSTNPGAYDQSPLLMLPNGAVWGIAGSQMTPGVLIAEPGAIGG